MTPQSLLFMVLALPGLNSAPRVNEPLQSAFVEGVRAEATGETLSGKCKLMLERQIVIFEHTKSLAGKKLRPKDKRTARRLASKEQKIVRMANRVIKELESEGNALAFPEVFRLVRDDMKNVQLRLKKGDVGPSTQMIEQDISESLREMISSLLKRH